jgi:membrane associated rhomboid family serine protease
MAPPDPAVAFLYNVRMGAYRIRPQPPGNNSLIPTVIFTLLVANGLAFAAQNASREMFVTLLGSLALWPAGSEYFAPWQIVTYGFLHGDLTHLLFNMFTLWMFGRDIERFWGPRYFVIYYLVCVVGAGIVQLLVAMFQPEIYPTIGASGGVFGILLAYGLMFPNRQILLLIPPIPMKAKYLVILFGVLELMYGVTGMQPGVAHFAHLGGMLFGFLLIQYWRRAR